MEAIYQYAWQHKMYHDEELTLDDGRPLRVCNPGIPNRDAGPDFSSARVEVDGVRWCGNVEIHVKASDWFRHGHDRDMAYDNIVLHVVAESDAEIRRADGTVIPQLTIRLLDGVEQVYDIYNEGIMPLRCNGFIKHLDPIEKVFWVEALAIERLQAKADRATEICKNLGGDWRQTCFALTARALGFGLNSEPMEMLGRNLPLSFSGRHADNIFQLEALIFGQAGLLDASENILDPYYQDLCREYYFLARKYGLRPMNRKVWKFARTRPQNFPHRRLAMLAQLLHGGFTLPGEITDTGDDIDRLRELFDIELSGYWAHRFNFGDEQRLVSCALSRSSVDILIINVAAPLLYAQGRLRGNYEMQENAVTILECLPSEKNSIVRSFSEAGIKADSAKVSQALIQLKKQYCDAGRCTQCRFGFRIMQLICRHWRDPAETKAETWNLNPMME